MWPHRNFLISNFLHLIQFPYRYKATFKKIVGDRPRPPHEKGPTPKNILFFILKKPAKKRFNID
jgi:hypothetical protein